MKEVFIIDAIRTPIGKYGGCLSSVRPDDLLAHTLKELLKRNPSLDPAAIEERLCQLSCAAERRAGLPAGCDQPGASPGQPLFRHGSAVSGIGWRLVASRKSGPGHR